MLQNLIGESRVDTHDTVSCNTNFLEHVDNIANLHAGNIYPVFEHNQSAALYTIGVTVYKRANYLKQCIDSALKQTTTIPYAVIVVDDDPRQGNEVEKVMEEYRHHPLVSYYKKHNNEGLMANMNRCISVAQSPWVLLIHDDDWLCSNYIAKIDEYRKSYSEYTIFVPSHSTYYFGKYVETKGKFRQWLCRVKKCWRTTAKDFINGTCATPTGTLYHRQTFIETGGFNSDYGMAADYCFFASYVHYHKMLRVNDELFNYRWAENESLNYSTILNFKKVGHYMAVFLLKHSLKMPKRIVDGYEGERLYLDFNGNIDEMRKVFSRDEIDYYTKRRNRVVYILLNFILKSMTFLS